MTKQSLFQHITKDHILQAIKRIDEEGYPIKRKSGTYNLVYNDVSYPPKYVTSLASYMANKDFLTHSQFGVGKESVCFAFLRSHGFKITTKIDSKDIPDAKSSSSLIHLKYTNRFKRNKLDEPLFSEYFSKYLANANSSDWFTEKEAYKFRCGRWLTSRIDFDSQSDQEVLDIIIESQEQLYSPGHKEKGLNFVTLLTRYNDSFISIKNIETLRKMRDGYIIGAGELKDTYSTWPVFSVWSGLLIPDKYNIIAKADLMKGFITLYNIQDPIMKGVRGFNLMNTYLNDLSSKIKERYSSELETLLAKVFPEESSLQKSDLAWFTQDFMLYMDHHVLNNIPSFYWVNQGGQYENELAHSCICANVDSTKPHHKRLKDLKQGDILLHYANQAIQATSIVKDTFTLRPRPYLDTDKKEIVVETEYSVLDKPIPIATIRDRLQPHQELLPTKHSPFDKNFGIVQAYCLLFNKASYDILFDLTSYVQNQNNMKYPLNTILYGPPGTGKTYNSINYSIGMIENKSLEALKLEDRSEIRKRYDEYVKKGQIVFSTFHQSMSYEDFIEGIKPVLLSDEADENSDEEILKYEIKSGIFKELVEKSIDTTTILEKTEESLFVDAKYFKENINKISLGNSKSPEDNEIYEYCIKNNCVALGWGEDLDYSKAKSKNDIINIFREGLSDFRDKKEFNIDAMNRFIFWMKEGQLVFIPNGNRTLRAIGVVDGDYYFDPEAPIRYSQFRSVEWLHVDLEIPIKSIYSKYFSQQSIYQIYGSEIDQSFFKKEIQINSNSDKFVMIIDEINRGNVSQIFGELITLIEEDKRSGSKEALSIKLPYSKEEFSVPNNIHILGTMNTADRSVEALDSALRRRFSFVEMQAQPHLLAESTNNGNIGDIDLVKLLTTINLRISKLIDSDHAIGHSYFFKVKTRNDLVVVFQDKVIPLLEEYFFGDLGKIGLVLGSTFIGESENSKSIKMKQFKGYGNNFAADMNDKKLYRIKSSAEWNFKDVYID